MKHLYKYKSPIGEINLISQDDKLIRSTFIANPYSDTIEKSDSILLKAVEWLDHYFKGDDIFPDIDFNLQVTPYQKSVLNEVAKIPFGETCSYLKIAKKLQSSPRAVGGAIAKNPVLLFIPCHRVIASNGKLTGYAGGIERKKFLIDLEANNYGNTTWTDHQTNS